MIKHIKRLVCAVLCAAAVMAMLSGCSGIKKNGKLKVIATIYPVYQWAQNIIGDNDNVELSLLMDKGVDLHSFQPTVGDIVEISSCDVFIYVGGISDSWVDDVLRDKKNKSMIAVDLMQELGNAAKVEELVEGMQGEEEEEDGAPEYDEHIWLSLKNASALCGTIAEKLGEADSGNKEAYKANAEAYIEKLSALDARYTAACQSAKNKTLIFADRFPFRYLTDDYDLTYYAAFVGCSAESEASFQTLVFLAGKLDELKLNKLIVTESSDKKIADAVIDTAKTKDVTILTLDSMQSSIGENDTYLSIMERNLEVLSQALS